MREIGTLRAVGFSSADVRSLFVREGIALATAGSVLGVIGAIGYGELMMYGLRTWWVGAVGHHVMLSLHLSGLSLSWWRRRSGGSAVVHHLTLRGTGSRISEESLERQSGCCKKQIVLDADSRRRWSSRPFLLLWPRLYCCSMLRWLIGKTRGFLWRGHAAADSVAVFRIRVA